MDIGQDQDCSGNTLLKVEQDKCKTNPSNIRQFENDSKYFYFSLFTAILLQVLISLYYCTDILFEAKSCSEKYYNDWVLLMALSTGIARTWPSPVFVKLRSINENPLNCPVETIQLSLISSLADVAQVISPYFYVFLMERQGRKQCMFWVNLPFVIGNVILGSAKYVSLYYLARILIGTAAGGTFSLLPVYISEISEKHNRGKFICLYIIFINLGCVYSYAIGPFLNVSEFSLVCAVPSILFLILYRSLSESPLYLMRKGKTESAKAIDRKLRKKTLLRIEHDVVETLTINSKEPTNIKIIIRSKTFRKNLIISVILLIAEPLSGIINMMEYSEEIFLEAGGEKLAKYFSIISGCYIVLTVFVAFCVIEKFKRKSLMLLGTFGTTVCLALLTTYFYLKNGIVPTNIYTSWIPFVISMLYITFFQCYGPTAWVVVNEMFSVNSTKAFGVGFATSMFLLALLISAFMFPIIADFVGIAQVFLIHNIFSLLIFIFILFVVPETKSKSHSVVLH